MPNKGNPETPSRSEKYSKLFAKVFIPVLKEFGLWERDVLPHGSMDTKYFRQLLDRAQDKLNFSKIVDLFRALRLKLQDTQTPLTFQEQNELHLMQAMIDAYLLGYTHRAAEVGQQAAQDARDLLSELNSPKERR